MRTFTTTHTVYSYDELSDDAKQVAIDDHRQFLTEVGYDDLSDAMLEQCKQLLDESKIKYSEYNLKTYYSLGYSQGDGAMFEGTFQWRNYEVAVKQSGNYYHYNSKSIHIETRYGNEAKQSVYNTFGELYEAIARKLEEYGYDYIEYEQSQEVIEDNIRANEYEFYETGKIA